MAVSVSGEEQAEGSGQQWPAMSRQRVVIEAVKPAVDGGRFPSKRTCGEKVVVEADIFADGHDVLAAVLRHRKEGDDGWTETVLEPLGNDRWRGEFVVAEIGHYYYTVVAWVDRFRSWRQDLAKKARAAQDVAVELLAGAELLAAAQERAAPGDRRQLAAWLAALRPNRERDQAERVAQALDEDLLRLMDKYADRELATTYGRELAVVVDREKARYSTWYEMFPRSCAREPGQHGTFQACLDHLPYVAGMGFDVLYLPPIHPIGRSQRKGRNNAPVAGPEDPGSPWGIGAAEGGHKAIDPRLGTLADFRRFVAAAHDLGLEVALDIALQCSPDHPYVREHPQWFRWRPDGTIQYAENPPKKYQDIYPLDFETEDWRALWEELRSVFLFWCEQGVRIFRVDNPHTKPFPFWQWLIAAVKRDYPETLFLAEAFTRPKVMYYLAKAGFAQSYTYFAWRNTKREITQYFEELTQTEVCEYFRPNLWPNTPDILTEYLQFGGRPAFMARLVLAATLGASYGIYGPAFELCENRARAQGSEEYLNSEKYELKQWDTDRPASLRDFITRVNRIRRENVALQSNASLRFHRVDNEQLLAYSKSSADGANTVLTVVNLDPHNAHAGWLDLPLTELGLEQSQPYQVHDLLTDARYLWQGARNYVALNPQIVPAAIFVLRRRIRSERDFEYFM